MWKPITLQHLLDTISETQHLLTPELSRFWQLIKIEPAKWEEKQHGNEGGGFWVIAICGNKVISYNDIEQGFNVSTFKTWGEITEYWCNDYEFNHIIYQLYYNY